MRCEWCGNPLVRRGTRGPVPSYCGGACRQAAFRARPEPHDPETPTEWQEAVDWARVLLLVDSARLYGLIETDLEVRVGRCEEILERGAAEGIVPRPDDELLADLFAAPA